MYSDITKPEINPLMVIEEKLCDFYYNLEHGFLTEISYALVLSLLFPNRQEYLQAATVKCTTANNNNRNPTMGIKALHQPFFPASFINNTSFLLLH